MPPKSNVPPNAKFQPQNPKYVSNETGSKDPEDIRYTHITLKAILSRARLFVGCLNLETCTRKDVIQLFSMYGPLKGATHFIKGGYAFIQYENAEDAEDAVLNLNRYMFQGIRLDVKFVQKSAVMAAPNRQAPKRAQTGLSDGP
jgi:RNA recognition motif-containing protein